MTAGKCLELLLTAPTNDGISSSFPQEEYASNNISLFQSAHTPET